MNSFSGEEPVRTIRPVTQAESGTFCFLAHYWPGTFADGRNLSLLPVTQRLPVRRATIRLRCCLLAVLSQRYLKTDIDEAERDAPPEVPKAPPISG